MYILLQIEEIAFSLWSYKHLYTHMHVIGNALICVGCSLKISRET